MEIRTPIASKTNRLNSGTALAFGAKLITIFCTRVTNLRDSAAVMMLPFYKVTNQKLQKMEPEFVRFRQIFAAPTPALGLKQRELHHFATWRDIIHPNTAADLLYISSYYGHHKPAKEHRFHVLTKNLEHPVTFPCREMASSTAPSQTPPPTPDFKTVALSLPLRLLHIRYSNLNVHVHGQLPSTVLFFSS